MANAFHLCADRAAATAVALHAMVLLKSSRIGWQQHRVLPAKEADSGGACGVVGPRIGMVECAQCLKQFVTMRTLQCNARRNQFWKRMALMF
jgi:hypothetical protein